MKLITSLLVLLFTSSVCAGTFIPTKGNKLHLTCILNFTPFFIELDTSHTKAKLSLNNRIDSEGNGQSREFITSLTMIERRETSIHKLMVFSATFRSKQIDGLKLQIPLHMDLYFGIPDQPAQIIMQDGTVLPGSCYVQFPPFAPQW